MHKCKLSNLFPLLFLSLLLGIPQVAFAVKETPLTFQSHLSRFQKVAGSVGIEVVSLPSGKVLFENRARETFTPASVVKILTSYAALKELGPYRRFSTTVWAADEPQGDTIPGNIWIKSEGDIFLLAQKAWILASKLKERGVRRIQGGILVDNSFFEPRSEQVCLDGECRSSYNPVLSATALEFNTIALRVSPASKVGGPVEVGWFPPSDYVQLINLAVTAPKTSKTHLKVQSLGMTADGREKYQITGKLPLNAARNYEYRFNVEDPATFMARSFRALLQQAGIDVRGTTAKAGEVPPRAKKLASHESPPLADLLYGLNRYSNNFMAEVLLRSLGAHVKGPPGTVEKGVGVVRASLRELGIPDQEAVLNSGSGLSRECRVSPHAFCRVLESGHRDFSIGPEFLASFAVNGQEGTLSRRLHLPGITVRGKTGTLNNVVSFAGYVSYSGKELYAVTVLLNDVQNLFEARDALDSFLEQLPGLAEASR